MFVLTEFVLEKVIKTGLKKIRDPEFIDIAIHDVYGTLAQQTRDEMRTFLLRTPIEVIQNVGVMSEKSIFPAISINMQSDEEIEGQDLLSDFEGYYKEDTNDHEDRMTRSRETIFIGVHTKNPVLTKLLFVMVKYIILSHKDMLERNNVQMSSLISSDFAYKVSFLPEFVYSRFLTIQSIHDDIWRQEIYDEVVQGIEITENFLIDKPVEKRKSALSQIIQKLTKGERKT